MSKLVIDVVTDPTTGQARAVLPEVKFSQNIANQHHHYQTPTATEEGNTLVGIPREETDGWRWANWGANDCLPTDIRTKIIQSPMASSAVYKLIKMGYGNGLTYFRNSDLRDGETTVKRAFIPEVEQWLKTNRIATKYIQPQIADFRFTMNTFSEMILNKRRDFITGLYHKQSEFCRLSKQNPDNNLIEWMFYSTHFSRRLATAQNTKRIHLLPWWNTDDYIAEHSTVYKFAWHARFETPGVTYYARPYWLGLFAKNGWIDASIEVPKIVNAMMRNQITLMYQILIPEDYFKIRHSEWETGGYTDKEKQIIINNLIDSINKELSGTENAFKSIATVFRQHEMTGNAEGRVEIIPIDQKVKKDSWVPTSDVADAQVVQGLGLHPSQVGLGAKNGGMGAGSGSDQREGYNTEISTNQIEQDTYLEALNYVATFNARTYPEWDITFCMDHTAHTTTNNQESGLQPSQTSLNLK